MLPVGACRFGAGGQVPGRLVWIGLYGVALFVVMRVLLPIKVAGVENDDYVALAQSILDGRLPRDPYRPLLYHLLSAACGWVLGNCFVGARLVSTVAACGLLWFAHELVRRCIGRREASLATLFIALNGAFIAHAMVASTDMLFAAFSVAALALAARVWTRPSKPNLVLLGGFIAAACFTRYQGVLLLVPAAFGTLGIRRLATSWSSVVGRLGVVFASLVVGLVPHFTLTWYAFGAVLHDENWRSVELKYYHDLVFSRIDSTSMGSVAAVLLHDPWLTLTRAGSDFSDYLLVLLPDLAAGFRTGSGAGICVMAVAAIGWSIAWRRRRAPLFLVMAYLGLMAVALCLTFVPSVRMALSQIPLTAGGLATVVLRLRGSPWRESGRRVFAVVLLGLLAVNAGRAVQELIRQQPWEEVAAARRLVAAADYPVKVLSAYGFLSTHLMRESCLGVAAPYPGEDLEQWSARTIDYAQQVGAAYVVLGRITCGAVVFESLCNATGLPLRIRERTESALVLEVPGVELDWIAEANVTPNPLAGGLLTITVSLRKEVDPEAVMVVGVVIHDDKDVPTNLPLPKLDALRYGTTLELAGRTHADGERPRSWRIVPVVCDRLGRFGSGEAVTLRLP